MSYYGSGDDQTSDKTYLPMTNTTTIFNDALTNSNATTNYQMRSQPFDVVLIGLVCGLIGLLVGVVMTVVVWLLLRRRRNARRDEKISSVEKNPQERTFEPLDLNLTKSSYGVSPPASNPVMRKIRESVISPDPLSGSYLRFEPPLPPQMFENEKELMQVDSSPKSEVVVDQCSGPEVINKVQLISDFHRNSMETEASGVDKTHSLAQRDSFSSGRGTGPNSDILTQTDGCFITKPSINHEPVGTSNQPTTISHHHSDMSQTSSQWSLEGLSKSPEVLSTYLDIHFPVGDHQTKSHEANHEDTINL